MSEQVLTDFVEPSRQAPDSASEDDDDDELSVALSVSRSLLTDSAEIEKEGWLTKRGEKRKSWKKRWFILRDNRLRYYTDQQGGHLKGEVNLTDAKIEILPQKNKYKNREHCFEVHTASRTFIMQAENGALVQDWKDVLHRAVLRIKRQEQIDEQARALLEQQEQQASRRVTGENLAITPTNADQAKGVRWTSSDAADTDSADQDLRLSIGQDPEKEKMLNFVETTEDKQRRGTEAVPLNGFHSDYNQSLLDDTDPDIIVHQRQSKHPCSGCCVIV